MSLDLTGFDWRKPDYTPIFIQRMNRLAWLREDPSRLRAIKLYYKDHVDDMINDWGQTYDPRNADQDLPTFVPFLLMPRQREFVQWIIERWKGRKNGLAEKSRDGGLSWLAISTGCCLCLTHTGIGIGFGSRKLEYVDSLENPKSLFYKGRKFMELLPVDFTEGFNVARDAPAMRMIFRKTKSTMTGEVGDSIGRGDRQSIYFVDEAAHLEHPVLTDAALAATTNCRVDISSVNGSGNPFEEKAHRARPDDPRFKFVWDWRDDMRKDQAWYDALDLDPVTKAQEVDRNYNASVEGVLIPSDWVESAIDALGRLGIAASGDRWGAMDVADEGLDTNAFAGGQGIELDRMEEWSGKGSDIFRSVEWAFMLCDQDEIDNFLYDADGMGASVRGDARVVNEKRDRMRQIRAIPFRGSASPVDPDKREFYKRANKDFFQNLKAQGYWRLRERFRLTHDFVTKVKDFDPLQVDELISINPALPCLSKLKSQLSQPTYDLNGAGKIVVDKKPDGTKSPNLADAVMIRYSGLRRGGLRVSQGAMVRAMTGGRPGAALQQRRYR